MAILCWSHPHGETHPAVGKLRHGRQTWPRLRQARREAPPPPPRGSGQVSGHCAPPSPRTRCQETRTGLQRALAHDRGEGAQALRRARRQPECILRVGLEVLHHKGCGWVEGAPHLGTDGVGVGGRCRAEGRREAEIREKWGDRADQRSWRPVRLTQPSCHLPPSQPGYLSASVALPEEQFILNDTLLPRRAPREPNASLRLGLCP